MHVHVCHKWSLSLLSFTFQLQGYSQMQILSVLLFEAQRFQLMQSFQDNLLDRVLGRGPRLISDEKFSVWNFLKGSESRRAALIGKLETAYKKSVLREERLPLFLDMSTPSVSRSPCTKSSPTSEPTLSRVSVTVSRCADKGVGGSAAMDEAANSSGKKN